MIPNITSFAHYHYHTIRNNRNIPYQVEVVHFLTDADSIGEAVCKRASALNAAAVCMAKHTRSGLAEFFLGSTTKYCVAHCKSPLVVLH